MTTLNLVLLAMIMALSSAYSSVLTPEADRKWKEHAGSELIEVGLPSVIAHMIISYLPPRTGGLIVPFLPGNIWSSSPKNYFYVIRMHDGNSEAVCNFVTTGRIELEELLCGDHPLKLNEKGLQIIGDELVENFRHHPHIIERNFLQAKRWKKVPLTHKYCRQGCGVILWNIDYAALAKILEKTNDKRPAQARAELHRLYETFNTIDSEKEAVVFFEQ